MTDLPANVVRQGGIGELAPLPPRKNAADALPRPRTTRPIPPRNWPWVTPQETANFARVCLKAGPQYLMQALRESNYSPWHEHGSKTELANILHDLRAQVGAAQAVDLLRSVVEKVENNAANRWKLNMITAWVWENTPDFVDRVARPEDAERLAAAWSPDDFRALLATLKPSAAEAEAWARQVFAKTPLPTQQAFVHLDGAWRNHRPTMARHLPRSKWALWVRNHPAREALAGWDPTDLAEHGPLTPHEVRDLCELLGDREHVIAVLPTALADTPPGPLAQKLFDATLTYPWMTVHHTGCGPLLKWACARKVDVVHGLRLMSGTEAPLCELLPVLQSLPTSTTGWLGGLAYARSVYAEKADLKSLLQLVAWLRVHAPEALSDWGLAIGGRLADYAVPEGLEAEEIADLRRLVGYGVAARASPPMGQALAVYAPDIAHMFAQLGDLLHLKITASVFIRMAEALGVPEQVSRAWAPWAEAVLQQEDSAAQRTALVLHFLEGTLEAKSSGGYRVPEVIRALLGLAGDLEVVPSGSPLNGLVLNCIVAALASNRRPHLHAEVLTLLLAHKDQLSGEQRLLCARAAANVQQPIWRWLTLTSECMPAWCELVCTQVPKEEELSAHGSRLVTWASATLAWGPDAVALQLLQWLTQHPHVPVPADAFFQRHELDTHEAHKSYAVVRQVLSQYYASLPVHQQERFVRGCSHVDLLPAAAQPVIAQTWLQKVDNSDLIGITAPLRALANCIHAAPVSEALPGYPELALVIDPEGVVRGGEAAWEAACKDVGYAAWLRRLAQGERRLEGDAAFAQGNRLRALGRFLFACHVAEVAPEKRDAVAPLVQQLLALADNDARHLLLMHLLGKVLATGDSNTGFRAVQEIMTHPPRALPLLLVAWLALDETAKQPHIKAVLHTGAVYGHGPRCRDLIWLLLDSIRPKSEVRDYAPAVLGWATDVNLSRVLHGVPMRERTQALLQAARDLHAANASAPQAAREKLHALQKEQVLCASTRRTLAQDRAKRGLPPMAVEANDLAPLREALTWFGSLPGLSTVIPEALKLATPEALQERQAAAKLAQVKSGLKAIKVQIPKQAQWQVGCCEALALDLDSFRPVQPVKTSVPAIGTPTAEFFEHKPVRAFMQKHVIPLIIELRHQAALVLRSGRAPGSFNSAAEVLHVCLGWTGLKQAQYSELANRCPELGYLSTYVSTMQKKWAYKERCEGLARLQNLARAVAEGCLDAWRRQGAQARAILQERGGEAIMRGWERCEPRELVSLAGAAVSRGATWTVEDTGAPGVMLAATTQVPSCQSASGGSLNRGMLGRITDGAKRLIILRDERGTPRARATIRLMRRPGKTPVILLSTIYGLRDDTDVHRIFWEHLHKRARALNIEAVRRRLDDEAKSSSCVKMTLVCANGAADYWDECNGIRDDTVVLKNQAVVLLRAGLETSGARPARAAGL